MKKWKAFALPALTLLALVGVGIARAQTATSSTDASTTSYYLYGTTPPPASTSTDTSTSTEPTSPLSPGIIGVGNIAQAPGTPVATIPATSPAPVVVDVQTDGNILIRGAIQSVNGNSITINSWGGEWTIRTQNNPQFISSDNTLASLKPNDFIGVMGTVAQDQEWTVNATLVRDWTTNPEISTVPPPTTNTSASSSADTTSMTSSSTAPTLYTGSASNIGTDSFTLTDDSGNTYTVSTMPDTTIWNTARQDISFSNIQTGHSLRINGDLQGDTITATVIRDTSI